jgi:hypothetical protein
MAYTSLDVVNGLNSPLYLIENAGFFSIANLLHTQKNTRLFSLVPTTVDANNKAIGLFYHEPRVIKSSQVIPYNAKVRSNTPIQIQIPYSIATITINGNTVLVTFSPTANVALIAQAINDAFVAAVDSSYSAVAAAVDTFFLEITAPSSVNSNIIIESNTAFDMYFNITPGEYFGDISFPAKSYIEDESFVLVEETITPNNGIATGKFLPVIDTNGILRYISEFDNGLISSNPRLKILIDAFAYAFQIIDSEAADMVDQVNLSKVDTDKLEYLAYLFGIDIEKLLTSESGKIGARDILRSITQIIHTKGTIESFKTILKFIGYSTDVKEYRRDGIEMLSTVTNADIDAFYSRFLIKDSIFRNPITNFGSTVATFTDLPLAGFDGEVVKVIDTNNIFQYQNDESAWISIFSNINPISGLGINPDAYMEEFNWKFTNKFLPYLNISYNDYNELKTISGFDLVPADTSFIDVGIYDYDESISPLRASIPSTVYGPYDLSDITKRTLNLFIDNNIVVDIDFSDYPSIIMDYSIVTIKEIRTIIETNFTGVSVAESSGRIILKSKRCGQLSRIKITSGNIPLGFTTGDEYYGHRRNTHIGIRDGLANPSPDNIQIPQINISTPIAIRVETTIGDPSTGTYDVYLNEDGSYIIRSDLAFRDAIYNIDLGWVSKNFNLERAVKLGYFDVINGEIAYIYQSNRQSDFKPAYELTTIQETAVRGFINSKKSGANRMGSTGPIAEQGLTTPEPYYYRDGSRNVIQTGVPDVSNEINLEISFINPNQVLTLDFIKQTTDLIEYVRPVHIRLLNLLFEYPDFRDYWPRVIDRYATATEENPINYGPGPGYMPGFWDGTQSVFSKEEIYIGSDAIAPGVFRTFYPMCRPTGGITSNNVDVSVEVNHVPVVVTAISGGMFGNPDVPGEVTIAPVAATDNVKIVYNVADGKYPWELDIKEFLLFMYRIDDGYIPSYDIRRSLTSEDQLSDVFPVSTKWEPTAGENDSLVVPNTQRNNPFVSETIPQSISLGVGSALYGDPAISVPGTWATDRIPSTIWTSPNKTIETAGSAIPAVGSNIGINGITYTFTAGITALTNFPEVGDWDVHIGISVSLTLIELDIAINLGTDNFSIIEYDNVGDVKLINVAPRRNLVSQTGEHHNISQSTLPLCSFSISNNYFNPAKKSMVNDYLLAMPVFDFFETAGSGSFPVKADGASWNSPNIPYYDTSRFLHKGHCEMLDDTTLLTEAMEPSYSVLKGWNGSDWENNSNSMYTNPEFQVTNFKNIENTDGGPIADADGIIIETAAGGDYRNYGMFDSNAIKIILWDENAFPVPITVEPTVIIYNGFDSNGVDLATLIGALALGAGQSYPFILL